VPTIESVAILLIGASTKSDLFPPDAAKNDIHLSLLETPLHC